MTPILQRDEPLLRQKAAPVPLSEIGSDRIRGLIADLRKAMHSQKDGIAIAAPQIGASVRIFVVDGELLSRADKEYAGEAKDLVFINPEITKLSREKHEMEEGCLSVRWLYGKVKRATRTTLRAHDEHGKKIERGASGLLAQIFQHETDHLNGVLFIDKAEEVWEMSAEEIAELQK
jgi:peptide deformylase